MTTEELKLLITGDSSGGQKAIEDFGKSLQESIEHPIASVQELAGELGEHLTASLGTMAGAVTAATGIIVAFGVAIFELTEKAAKVGADIERMSTKVGDTTENISKLKYAVDVAGGSLESLTNVAYMISVRLGDTGAQGEKARSAIERLGIDVNEFLDASPSERVLLLSDALRSTGESGDVVRRALMDLGGRGVRDQIDVLSKDLRGLEEQGERMGAVWSETDAKAAEEFEMQVNALHEQWDLLSTNIGKTFIPTFLEFAKAINGLSEALHRIPDAIPAWMIDLLSKQFGFQDLEWASTMLGAANEVDRQRNSTNIFGGKTSVSGNRGDIDLPSENIFGGPTTVSGDALKPSSASKGGAGKGGAGSDLNLYGGITTINKDIETSFQDLSFKVQNFGSDLDLANESARNYLHNFRAEIQAAADTWTDEELDSKVLEFADVTIPHVESSLKHFEIHSAFAQWKSDLDELSSGLQKLAQVSGGTFGGILQNIASDMAALDLTTKSTDKFMESDTLSGKATGAMGMATGFMQATHSGQGKASGALSGAASGAEIGSMFGPWGTAIGAGAGALVGWARNTGPSKDELAGRDVEKQFEQSMGGWQGIQKALLDTGLAADQTNEMIQKLWASEKQGAGATQLSIDAINKLIKDHTADVAKGVDGILAAAKTVGANFPAAMQPMVDKLMSLPGLTDAEKKSLDGLMKGAEPDFKALTDMASTYGLKLKDLGPAFQQADISSRADKIITDFKSLTKAGADGDKVLAGMGKSINDLVNDAMKYGSTLPTVLKPLIEQLAKTGQLTDESGKKFSDVSKLTFDDSKDPLAKGLDNLTTTIQKLIDLLSGTKGPSVVGAIGQVQSAAANIPRNPFADWQVPDLGAEGPIPQASGWSGRVTRPTLFLAGEAGPEDVSFGGAHRSGGGSGGGIHVNISAIDGASVKAFVESGDFKTALLQAVARDGNGFGRKFSRAIPKAA